VAVLDDTDDKWLAVIGRALAYLSLHIGDLRDKEIGQQAEFLQALGLESSEMAPLIGSTEASVDRLLQYRRKNSKRGKSGGKASKNAKPARRKKGKGKRR
jgi:hypothetical protein